ncbi:MAG: hypothetical protein LBP89_02435 [Helicobacteraceae bacterium]|nr:hypothetical protein [Helicobacteraceae bacterium]
MVSQTINESFSIEREGASLNLFQITTIVKGAIVRGVKSATANLIAKAFKSPIIKPSFSKTLIASAIAAFALSFTGCGTSDGGGGGDDTTIINAQTPVITTQPTSANYNLNNSAQTLIVKASVSDGGTLSYQWYKNTENNTESATQIDDETDNTFTPPTNALGEFYYYAIVTNTNSSVNGNPTASVTSDIAVVTVNATNTPRYNVSFYNADLDFVETKLIVEDPFNPLDHNNSVSWYKANDLEPTTSHNLDATR